MRVEKTMNSLKEIAKIIKKSNSIAIFTHINPDFDALGSSMSLYYALKKDYQDLSDHHMIGKIAHKFGNLPAKLLLLLLLGLLIACSVMLVFGK